MFGVGLLNRWGSDGYCYGFVGDRGLFELILTLMLIFKWIWWSRVVDGHVLGLNGVVWG